MAKTKFQNSMLQESKMISISFRIPASMHSSRMRTALLLPACTDLGGVCSGGVSAPGVSALGGVCSRGCLLPGGCLLLGRPGRCLLLGEVCSWGGCLPPACVCVCVCIPACTEADTPSVNRMTDTCKNITSFAGGNNSKVSRKCIKLSQTKKWLWTIGYGKGYNS